MSKDFKLKVFKELEDDKEQEVGWAFDGGAEELDEKVVDEKILVNSPHVFCSNCKKGFTKKDIDWNAPNFNFWVNRKISWIKEDNFGYGLGETGLEIRLVVSAITHKTCSK